MGAARGGILKTLRGVLFGVVLTGSFFLEHLYSQQAIQVTTDWNKVEVVSKTTPTLQVVANPMLQRGSPIHDSAYAAVQGLGADYVRYVPWLPYPRLAVAELKPPRDGKTFWDFHLIDPMTLDFLDATKGHSVILNFSTIPQWMFKTPQPVTYPADPKQVDWHYTQGTQLRDPSMKELSGYYARLVSWYVDGGFTDEFGRKHVSGYHYSVPYWEVFNEVASEHSMTPQQYTERYDAVVSAIHKVSPDTQFVALALGEPGASAKYFEYFLNHKNHKPGIPLDMISYHFYASPAPSETIHDWQYTFFDQAAGFLNTVRYVEAIRKRLSPETRTALDELGVILPGDNGPSAKRIPPAYWNLAGAMYAYLYLELTKLGIDVVGESQLVGYPSQYPSVTMIDWKTGKPNARFWVLKLIKDNFGAGDRLVRTGDQGARSLEVQAFITPAGHKLLFINKRDRTASLTIPEEFSGATVERVDLSTGEGPPQSSSLHGNKIILAPFEVCVVK